MCWLIITALVWHWAPVVTSHPDFSVQKVGLVLAGLVTVVEGILEVALALAPLLAETVAIAGVVALALLKLLLLER